MENYIFIKPCYQANDRDKFFQDLVDDELKSMFFDSDPDLYQIWERRTREGLDHGQKALLLAFDTSPNKDSSSVAGACIVHRQLTLRSEDLFVELVYVSSPYRNSRQTRPRVGTSLIEKAMSLCEIYGYRKLVAVAREENRVYINFLVSNGFKFSHYDFQSNTCTFFREPKSGYSGDPYDLSSMMKWLMSKWGAKSIMWESERRGSMELSIGGHGGLRHSVSIEVLSPDLGLLSDVGEIDGSRLIILDTDPSIDDKPAFEEIRKINNNIIILSPSDIRRESKNSRFEIVNPDDIAAVVVPIDKIWWDVFMAKKGNTQTYIDGGAYANLLQRAIDIHEKMYILFGDSTAGYSRVLGMGIVESAVAASPSVIWEDYGHMSYHLDKSSFDRYTNVKTVVTAINFTSLICLDRSHDFIGLLGSHGWNYITRDRFYDDFGNDVVEL